MQRALSTHMLRNLKNVWTSNITEIKAGKIWGGSLPPTAPSFKSHPWYLETWGLHYVQLGYCLFLVWVENLVSRPKWGTEIEGDLDKGFVQILGQTAVMLCVMWPVIFYGKGVQTFYYSGPHTLLWAGSRAASGKITVNGVPNRINYGLIFTVQMWPRGA